MYLAHHELESINLFLLCLLHSWMHLKALSCSCLQGCCHLPCNTQLRCCNSNNAFHCSHCPSCYSLESHNIGGVSQYASAVVIAGDMEADEVVHLFVAPGPALLEANPAEALPHKSLKGFARVTVMPGQHQTVQLPLSSKDFQYAASGEA